MMRMRLNNTLFQIPIINNVLYYDTIDSTNNKAKELAKRGSVHGSLVVAKSQTAGRGRMGRSFSSADNQGLYFRLMLRPNVSMNHLSSITLVTALAVSTALDTICNINTTIKWPNDVYINNKKAVGILTEAGPDYVVIGIGINVNTKEFPSDISDTATSLYLETGMEYDLAIVLSTVLESINKLYHRFVSDNSLDFSYTNHLGATISFIEQYNSRLGSLNKQVYIIPYELTKQAANPALIDTSELEAMLCKGIDSAGCLICIDSKGYTHQVNSGEVSLRLG